MPAISFKNVSYSYVDGDESFLALEDIDLEIADGEFVCLIGMRQVDAVIPARRPVDANRGRNPYR